MSGRAEIGRAAARPASGPAIGSEDALERRLASARALGILSPLDVELALRLARLYGETRPGVAWAIAVVCRQEAVGHVCADLPRLAAEGLVVESEGRIESHVLLPADEPFEDWIGAIEKSPLVARAEAIDASEPRPLVLDGARRLYLRRSFDDQRRLAESLRRRLSAPDLAPEGEGGRSESATPSDASVTEMETEARLGRLALASGRGTETTRRALELGRARPLSIVTGGPGTGKTTLVVRLLALLIEEALAHGRRPPSIRLLAPTGKAAAALGASVVRGSSELDVADGVREALPTTAETLHRALRRQTRRDAFGRPHALSLTEDVVVVDEASMVDLAMMARLFEACREVERLILLGDPDQLASVDSGAVLGELCQAQAGGAGVSGLERSIVTLRESHRFAAGGDIARLAEAIRIGDADAMLELLDDPALPAIERCDVESVEVVRGRLLRASLEGQRSLREVEDPGTKLARMGAHRVLCAHRRGPLGVEALCAVLDEAMAFERRTPRRSGWWRGRLLLVTRNAPDQDLWNGDVGLVEETGAGLRALFPDGSGGVRMLSAGRLPAHESAIAMSIHKSQGSEFESVDLVLGNRVSRLMTRELLYTGVTRARERLRIHASPEMLREAVARRVQRDSGLRDALRAETSA